MGCQYGPCTRDGSTASASESCQSQPFYRRNVTRLQNASSSYLFQFRLMQTDQLLVELCDATGLCSVDFGAACEYTKEFMDNWLHLLQAAARESPQNEIMLNARVDSMMLLTTPFRPSTPQPFALVPPGN
ncbi:hypothetical protein L210DRAFT_3582330 [Boletus edulis BED1]|uniref:Uncharacterized protein n=1 Tax=Boletus edulis BED1 TaxID=1328754 RepID=A0AAD4BC33_BOLED|nr:hypothetical protein L210DRAFT_3582330 [Boletus edulis BED1]